MSLHIHSLFTNKTWPLQQCAWLALINFYSHLNSAGLMTSIHQYRQALAYLRNGERELATAQFEQLLADSLVGDAAAQALSSLAGDDTTAAFDDPPVLNYAESIPLQRIGNQYAVALANEQQEKINLLIDTGASITAMTSASFHSLGMGVNARQQDRRVFRTAGGVVMGTVYTVPVLRLGPFQLKDTQVAVIDFETHREINGLLGMNILGRFRFQIDQENAQLHLDEK